MFLNRRINNVLLLFALMCTVQVCIAQVSTTTRTVTCINDNTIPIWIGIKGGIRTQSIIPGGDNPRLCSECAADDVPNTHCETPSGQSESYCFYNPLTIYGKSITDMKADDYKIEPEQSKDFSISYDGSLTRTVWQGTIVGRTGCIVNPSNNSQMTCETANCVTGSTYHNANCLKEDGTYADFASPATRAELLMTSDFTTDDSDRYLISLINGHNVPMELQPTPGQNLPTPEGEICSIAGDSSASPSSGFGSCSWDISSICNIGPYYRFVTGSDAVSAPTQCVDQSACHKTGNMCGLAYQSTASSNKQYCGSIRGYSTPNAACTLWGDNPPFSCWDVNIYNIFQNACPSAVVNYTYTDDRLFECNNADNSPAYNNDLNYTLTLLNFASNTWCPTLTATSTTSFSQTVSKSSSQTQTITPSQSHTPSQTTTQSHSQTTTQSHSQTTSPTISTTITPPPTPTPSFSTTNTDTLSQSHSISISQSSSLTGTQSQSATIDLVATPEITFVNASDETVWIGIKWANSAYKDEAGEVVTCSNIGNTCSNINPPDENVSCRKCTESNCPSTNICYWDPFVLSGKKLSTMTADDYKLNPSGQDGDTKTFTFKYHASNITTIDNYIGQATITGRTGCTTDANGKIACNTAQCVTDSSSSYSNVNCLKSDGSFATITTPYTYIKMNLSDLYNVPDQYNVHMEKGYNIAMKIAPDFDTHGVTPSGRTCTTAGDPNPSASSGLQACTWNFSAICNLSDIGYYLYVLNDTNEECDASSLCNLNTKKCGQTGSSNQQSYCGTPLGYLTCAEAQTKWGANFTCNSSVDTTFQNACPTAGWNISGEETFSCSTGHHRNTVHYTVTFFKPSINVGCTNINTQETNSKNTDTDMFVAGGLGGLASLMFISALAAL